MDLYFNLQFAIINLQYYFGLTIQRIKIMRIVTSLALLIAMCPAVVAAGKKEDGFVPMFNGKDLDGWVNVNCAPKTFFVKDDMVVTTGKPTGYLRTAKQFENFIAEFDWMHVPPEADAVGNSGFFVWADPIPAIGTGYSRGIEVQVLVNLTYKNKNGEVTASSHGDLFSIWGATCVPDRPHPNGSARCIPSENRAKGANEWNHYRVEAIDGVIKLHVNGKEVSGVSKCNPRKGYLALESEGSECRFRNLKIKELASTNPKPEETADVDKGFEHVYSGLDLSNFKQEKGHNGHWQPSDWKLHYDGQSEAEPRSLYVDKEYGDCEVLFDSMLPAKKPADDQSRQASAILREVGDYMLAVSLRADGRLILMENIGSKAEFVVDKVVPMNPPGKWNRTMASLKGDKVSIFVNNKLVVEGLTLKLPAKKGEIALMDTGNEVDFANLYIRELK